MSKEISTQVQTVTDAELTMHLENLGLLKDLTNGEKNSYLQIAKAFNLNPFKREIHVSKYGGQMSIITGYEVYIKRAERTGQLDGWSVTTSGTVKDNDLKATVTIHRKDRTHPFVWEAIYSEYVQLKDGKPNKFWQKATTMIKKVAISQGFRLCFSDELGGMPYTADEMEQQTQDVAAVVTTVETAPKWEATPEQWREANELLAGSTLDSNGMTKGSNSLSNAKSQAAWDKIVNRLRELQTVPA
jgi:phage recombination protein Bet